MNKQLSDLEDLIADVKSDAPNVAAPTVHLLCKKFGDFKEYFEALLLASQTLMNLQKQEELCADVIMDSLGQTTPDSPTAENWMDAWTELEDILKYENHHHVTHAPNI